MREKKGFTLIELMIVIAIISIIAVIAIPNLLQSRIRANETSAVSQIRNYAAAQSIFQERDSGVLSANRGKIPGKTSVDAPANKNGYCAQYDLLYYGSMVIGNAAGAAIASTTRLRLISMAHANASRRGSSNVTAALNQMFNGYWFAEPTLKLPDSFYDTCYAQIAYPDHSSRSGSKAFYFDDTGTVMSRLLPADSRGTADTIEALKSPVDGDATGWTY